MYGLTVYIEPKDILDRLSERDKARFNQCVFYDVRKMMDGSIEIECRLFNETEPENLYSLSASRTKLLSEEDA